MIRLRPTNAWLDNAADCEAALEATNDAVHSALRDAGIDASGGGVEHFRRAGIQADENDGELYGTLRGVTLELRGDVRAMFGQVIAALESQVRTWRAEMERLPR